jgi:cytochrome P450
MVNRDALQVILFSLTDKRVIAAIAAGALAAAWFHYRSKLIQIPGPASYPLLGNLLYLTPFREKMASDKMFLAISQQYGPLARIVSPITMKITLVLSDAEEAKRVLNQSDLFTKGIPFNGVAKGLFLDEALFSLPTDAVWYRHRKLLQPSFGPSHIRQAGLIVEKKIEDAIEYWKSKEADGKILINDFFK